MIDIELTSEERIEFVKRGFFVKKIATFSSFLKSIISLIIIINLFGGILYMFTSNIDIMINSMIVGLIISGGFILMQYLYSSSIFYGNYGLIGFGSITSKQSIDRKIGLIGIFSTFLKGFWKILVNIGDICDLILHKKGRNPGIFGFILFIAIILAMMGSDNFYGYFTHTSRITGQALSIYGVISLFSEIFYGIIFCCFGWLINKSINTIIPIYAFGNIGEKIQKITPKIAEQSKRIQGNFGENMNFSILSEGFNSLSSTFSHTILLVMRLEKLESRANKGNIFDSKKYIDSLRTDIIEPLISLRSFLETQKVKLNNSQEEFMQVQVRGAELSRNEELSSKRSEILIQELTENIKKLNGMIEKMR